MLEHIEIRHAEAYRLSVDNLLLEELVQELYLKHRLCPAEPVSPWRLTRLELGGDAILSLRCPSSWFKLRGKHRIALDSRTPVERASHELSHELGHAVFDKFGIRFSTRDEEEHAANIFGGAVLAPRMAVQAMHRAMGLDVAKMARVVVSTPTWAALRLGEALPMPCVVETPQRVRVRGPGWGKTDAATALMRAKASPLGLRKTLGPGRMAYFPDALVA